MRRYETPSISIHHALSLDLRNVLLEQTDLAGVEMRALLRLLLDPPQIWEVNLQGLSCQIHPRFYVCPHCCDLWADLLILNRWDYIQYIMPCLGCDKPGLHLQQTPGSLLVNQCMIPGEPTVDEFLLKAIMPHKELMTRELELHIQAWKRRELNERPDDFNTAACTVKCYYTGAIPSKGS